MPTDKHRRFVEVTLAGLSHHAYKDRKNEVALIPPTEVLTLEAEPGNHYDSFAVKVLRTKEDGSHEVLGYIGKSSIQQTVSNFLRSGHKLVASIGKVEAHHVTLQVWHEKPAGT